MTTQDFTIRLANTSDQKNWDSYVHAHPEASPYHLFGWKRAVEKTYAHKSYYLLAEKNTAIKGILPLIYLRFPCIVNELTALPFCDVGNILSDNDLITELLLQKLLDLAEELNCGKIHLRGKLTLPPAYAATFPQENSTKVRMILQLPGSSEALSQSFKSKLRSQIRKSEKNELHFYWGESSDIDDYYQVFTENMHALGSPVHSKSWFTSILTCYEKNARLGLVSFKGKTIGGCILLSAGKTIAIPWASTLRAYNKLAPNMLLYWNALSYAADAGFKHFDFGRSTAGEGTFKFKRQWGAAPIPLRWYSNTAKKNDLLSAPAGDSEGGRKKVAQMWARLPLPLANFLGPKIRKHISL